MYELAFKFSVESLKGHCASFIKANKNCKKLIQWCNWVYNFTASTDLYESAIEALCLTLPLILKNEPEVLEDLEKKVLADLFTRWASCCPHKCVEVIDLSIDEESDGWV